MSSESPNSRERVVEALLEVFREHGYAGASLSEISRMTGLGKSSLYYHFPGGKEDMANAVIDLIKATMHADMLAPLKGYGSPRTRLKKMIEALHHAHDGGRQPSVLGNLSLGASNTIFRERLQNAFHEWVKALEGLAVDAGMSRRAARERAEEAVALIEGSLVLSSGMDDPSHFQRALKRLPNLLLSAQ